MFFVQNALIINTKIYYLLCNLLLLKKNVKIFKKTLAKSLKGCIIHSVRKRNPYTTTTGWLFKHL